MYEFVRAFLLHVRNFISNHIENTEWVFGPIYTISCTQRKLVPIRKTTKEINKTELCIQETKHDFIIVIIIITANIIPNKLTLRRRKKILCLRADGPSK